MSDTADTQDKGKRETRRDRIEDADNAKEIETIGDDYRPDYDLYMSYMAAVAELRRRFLAAQTKTAARAGGGFAGIDTVVAVAAISGSADLRSSADPDRRLAGGDNEQSVNTDFSPSRASEIVDGG